MLSSTEQGHCASAGPQVPHICITKKTETPDQPWEKKRGHWAIRPGLSPSQTDVVRAEALCNLMTPLKVSHHWSFPPPCERPTPRMSHHRKSVQPPECHPHHHQGFVRCLCFSRPNLRPHKLGGAKPQQVSLRLPEGPLWDTCCLFRLP